MITCYIKPWAAETNIVHTSTLWKLYEDEAMTKLLEEKRLSRPNQLEVFTSDVVVPKGKIYYVTATREFADSPTTNHTIGPKPILNLDKQYNNLILTDNIKIEQPMLYINEDEFKDPDSIDFEVRTSAFRCLQDGHTSTHWYILSGDGSVLFTSLYDKHNKTSIRISKTQDILNKTKLLIRAIHVGTNGYESKYGELSVVNNEFTFDLSGSLKELTPFSDATLSISPSTARANVASVYLTSLLDATNPINITPNANSSDIIIPGSYLSYGNKYYLDIYCYNKYGDYVNRRFYLTVREFGSSGVISEHEYKLKSETIFNNNQSINLPLGFTTEEMVSGDILIPSPNSTNLKVYKTKVGTTGTGSRVTIDFGVNGEGFGTRSDIGLSSNTTDNMLIKFITDELLLIDNYNTNNKPTFLLYRYDRVNNVFNFIQRKERTDETICMGYTNSIFMVDNETLWYKPSLSNVIKSYNITTNEVKEVMVLSDTSFNNGSMFYNRILNKIIVTNSNGKLYVINKDNLEMIETGIQPFSEWTDSILKFVELRNKDYLIYNIKNPSSDKSVVYYKSKENKFIDITKTISQNSTFSGVITSIYNEVFSITNLPNSDGGKIYTMIKVF